MVSRQGRLIPFSKKEGATMPERQTWEDVNVQSLLIPVNNPIPKFHPVQLSEPIVLTQVL